MPPPASPADTPIASSTPDPPPNLTVAPLEPPRSQQPKPRQMNAEEAARMIQLQLDEDESDDDEEKDIRHATSLPPGTSASVRYRSWKKGMMKVSTTPFTIRCIRSRLLQNSRRKGADYSKFDLTDSVTQRKKKDAKEKREAEEERKSRKLKEEQMQKVNNEFSKTHNISVRDVLEAGPSTEGAGTLPKEVASLPKKTRTTAGQEDEAEQALLQILNLGELQQGRVQRHPLPQPHAPKVV